MAWASFSLAAVMFAPSTAANSSFVANVLFTHVMIGLYSFCKKDCIAVAAVEFTTLLIIYFFRD